MFFFSLVLTDSPLKSCLEALPVLQHYNAKMNQLLPLIQNTEVTRQFLGMDHKELPKHHLEIDLISEASKSKLKEVLAALSKRKPENFESLINKTMQKVLETSIIEDKSRTVLCYQFDNTTTKNQKYTIRDGKVFICYQGGLISLLNTSCMNQKEQMEGILVALKRKENSWLLRRYYLQQSTAKFETDYVLQIRNGIAYFRIKDNFYFLDSKEKMSVKIQCVCFLKAINEEQNEKILFGAPKIKLIHAPFPFLTKGICLKMNNHIYIKKTENSYYKAPADVENIIALKRSYVKLKEIKSQSILYHKLSNTPTEKVENIIVKENKVFIRVDKDIYASLNQTKLSIIDQKRKLKQILPNLQLEHFEKVLNEKNMLIVNKNLDNVKAFKNPSIVVSETIIFIIYNYLFIKILFSVV